ncbi:hypothetical protein [uncultured Algimonas sp.]|uniref:hypothetical protein n=1 Tax=uncultured Algimonas sp. TaxID=1547920 RepID=UPI00262B4C1C|nr:hypothetical protein [uncultured Algimonas sp.]
MLLPSLIMFAITVVVATTCLVPAAFKPSSSLVGFYWSGFWLFLALIAALAGGEQALMLSGQDVPALAARLQVSAILCFMLFVMFGWARLSGAALWHGVRRVAARS